MSPSYNPASLVREVPTHLSRELIVRNLEATPEYRTRPINQIVENTNITKRAEIKGKVLAVRTLLGGDVTIDRKETKDLLKRDNSWPARRGRTGNLAEQQEVPGHGPRNERESRPTGYVSDLRPREE